MRSKIAVEAGLEIRLYVGRGSSAGMIYSLLIRKYQSGNYETQTNPFVLLEHNSIHDDRLLNNARSLPLGFELGLACTRSLGLTYPNDIKMLIKSIFLL